MTDFRIMCLVIEKKVCFLQNLNVRDTLVAVNFSQEIMKTGEKEKLHVLFSIIHKAFINPSLIYNIKIKM